MMNLEKAARALKPPETGRKKADVASSLFTRRVSFVGVHLVHKVHPVHFVRQIHTTQLPI
jgi:hypothetical protein